MGKSREADPQSLQKYGVPLYSAAWLPYKELRSKLQPRDDHVDSSKQQEQQQQEEEEEKIPKPSASSHEHYVVLAGGGGEGSSGIPNAVLLSCFDFSSNSLSSQPVAKLGLGSQLPYRMVVHPGGDGVICAFPSSCRFFDWDEVKDNEDHKLGLKPSKKVLTQLEDVGQQLALAFNSDSSVLAVGGEDGNLRVFKWPGMEIILNETQAHASLKDLCFSPDGKFLVSMGQRDLGRVWDVTSSTAVASLPKENDEIFASCRFSQRSDQAQVLYIAAITDKGSSIVTWNTSSWKRMSSKHVAHEPVSSFNVSPDGKLLAMGMTQGDVLLVNSTNLRVQTLIRKAHLGIVTALAFSHDSRALVSASMDSSARVTLIEDNKSAAGGSSMQIIIFIIILAIAAYFLKNEVLPFLV